MKIKLLSDLHMESYKFTYEYAGEDVVVLAGDIHTRNRHEEIISQIHAAQPNLDIIFITGNHEYYGEEFSVVNEWFSNQAETHNHVHFLENTSIKLNGVNFYGGPMFTDFKLYGESSAHDSMMIARNIADFRYIGTNGTRWVIQDHIDEHARFVTGLEKFLQQDHEKRVVISHFMPSEKMSHRKYVGDAMNPFFIANMEKYMGWKGLWLCGHGHSSGDVMVGDTRIVMNPRGYGDENVWGFNSNLILEV
jgi:predicted phosphohydrolase